MDDKLTRGLAYTDKARASGSDTHATHGLGFNREGIQCVRSCNGGEVTDRPQDPTYGKRSRQIPDIKKIEAPRKPKPEVSHEEKLHVPSVTAKKKSQGPKL